MQNYKVNLDTLYKAILDISMQTELNSLWEIVCKNLKLLISAEKIYIILDSALNSENNQTEMIASWDNDLFTINPDNYPKYNEKIFKELTKNSQNVWIDNRYKDDLLDSLFKNNLTVLAVPIKIDDLQSGLILISISLNNNLDKAQIASMIKIYSLQIEIKYNSIKHKIQLEAQNNQILKLNSDLKLNNLYLENINIELSKNKSKFKFLADSIPHLVWSADILGNINYFNNYCCQYFNETPEELKKGNWLKAIHQDHIKTVCDLWRSSLKTGEPYNVELKIKRFDGEYRWFLVRAVFLNDQIENDLKWFGTCTDIHEQKENEEKIKSTNEELKEFAYIASHDLQEPLRTISGYTTLLAKRYKTSLDDDANEFVEFITEATKRMQLMINDLLEYSQISDEHSSLHLTDLNKVINKVLENLKLNIEETQGKVTFDNLPVIPTRESLMTLLFRNLLTNGLKYNESEFPHVHISCTKKADKFIFSVTDNGIGIQKEYLGKIFQIFKRLHTRDKYTGTGIGLAICKKIVEKHGGTIWVESEFNHGTSFYFYLKA